jgi:hypothetical protein
MAKQNRIAVSSGSLEPPPSADPGTDHERILREIQDAEPKFGCLGRTVTGCGALIAMGSLVLAIVYLIGRRGS